LINEIILRHIKGIHKKALLGITWPAFHEKRKKEREERQREYQKLKRDGKEVPENSDVETAEMEKQQSIKNTYFFWHI